MLLASRTMRTCRWGDSAVPGTRLARGTRRGSPAFVCGPTAGWLSCSAARQLSSSPPQLSGSAGGVSRSTLVNQAEWVSEKISRSSSAGWPLVPGSGSFTRIRGVCPVVSSGALSGSVLNERFSGPYIGGLPGKLDSQPGVPAANVPPPYVAPLLYEDPVS